VTVTSVTTVTPACDIRVSRQRSPENALLSLLSIDSLCRAHALRSCAVSLDELRRRKPIRRVMSLLSCGLDAKAENGINLATVRLRCRQSYGQSVDCSTVSRVPDDQAFAHGTPVRAQLSHSERWAAHPDSRSQPGFSDLPIQLEFWLQRPESVQVEGHPLIGRSSVGCMHLPAM
jgi:hypothetical protein